MAHRHHMEACTFFVAGPPIAGEDARERTWRTQIATAARAAGAPPASGIVLAFALVRERTRIDVDNLARPALDALRDAGVLSRGFTGLAALLATKRAEETTGLSVTATTDERVRQVAVPGQTQMTVTADELPREGQRDAKLRWRQAVATAWGDQPSVRSPVSVDVAVSTSLSLKDLLKPILDGLEPVLGRDPRGHLEFSPNDDLVTWLRVVRTSGRHALVARLATHETP